MKNINSYFALFCSTTTGGNNLGKLMLFLVTSWIATQSRNFRSSPTPIRSWAASAFSTLGSTGAATTRTKIHNRQGPRRSNISSTGTFASSRDNADSPNRPTTATTGDNIEPRESTETSTTKDASTSHDVPIWNSPLVQERVAQKRRNNKTRFRQHVNPLARQYQQPTILSEEWPRDTYHSLQYPLHLDIGCGKGGFLLNMTEWAVSSEEQHSDDEKTDLLLGSQFNYLGLEIRPGVAQYARERIERHPSCQGRLDFIGCNVNVDLQRILQRYQDTAAGPDDGLLLQCVTIQFPDPHFKAQHAKRRVVTPELVQTLAKYMKQGSILFLQSDIQSVLDDMRLRFRENDQFVDTLADMTDYYPKNIFPISTEREVSVLERGLPVYRALFHRT